MVEPLAREFLVQLRILTCFIAAVLTPASFGQTQIDLRTQGRNIDFSAATSTKPVKTNTGLPATCTVGDLYFRSDAAAGNNLVGCTSLNTWVLLGDGIGGGGDLQDFTLASTSTMVSVSCPTGACLYRIGEKVFFFTTDSSATGLSGSGASGTVFFYINASGVRAFGHDGTVVTGATLSNLVGETGVTSFPADSFPLSQCSVNGNLFLSCTDLRAAFGRTIADPGPGILITQNPSSGKTTVAINPSYVPTLDGSNTFTGSNSFIQVASGVAAVSFSATPIFDALLGSHQTILLTGNVTSSTIVNFAAGETLTFKICQDGSGFHTFTWPGNVHGGMVVGSSVNTCSTQVFVSYDGILLHAVSTGVADIL